MILYVRMFLLMGISLYTSRINLQALGIDNYGIYTLVGSVMAMFSFINNSLSISTGRFLNVEFGRSQLESIKQTFTACFTIHGVISLVILLLGETVGLWLLNYKLNIPADRMFAANWVFQLSVLGTCIGVLGAPFGASIVAKEKMGLYSYLGIGDAVLKFSLAFFLLRCHSDRLIIYAVLLFVFSLAQTVFLWTYCLTKFDFTSLRLKFDKSRIKVIASFSGWSVFGQLAFIASTTGVGMVVNIFFGVALNAALGLANQVNSAICNFVHNFQTAFRPQLVQSYAANAYDEYRLLLSRATRVSFYLMLIIALPVLVNLDTILNWWLTEVPSYTVAFIGLIIMFSFLELLGQPLYISMSAVGNIRNYQLIVSLINILNLPITYWLFMNSFSPVYMLITRVVLGLVIYLFRIYYVLPRIKVSYLSYWNKEIYPILKVCVFVIVPLFCLNVCISSGLYRVIASALLVVGYCCPVIFKIGLLKTERISLKCAIYSKFQLIKNHES